MNNYRDIFKQLAVMGVIGFPLTIGGAIMLFSADHAHSPGGGIFACAAIIAGATVLAWPLARLVAEPSGKLFYPDRRYSRPQPVYSIPQSKRAKGLYEEAIAGFEKIAADHPDEAKPYIEMIDICIVHLKDPVRANEIYQRGMSLLKMDKDKEALATMYSAIRTRLDAKPSN
jgi:hypothetical protein